MIAKCQDCGNDFEKTQYLQTRCRPCQREAVLKRVKGDYQRNREYYLEYARKRREERRAGIPDVRFRSKKKALEYCLKQQGENGIGCLECTLSDCVQVAFYRGEVEKSKSFESRYFEIKKRSWLNIDEPEQIDMYRDVLPCRTIDGGKAKHKIGGQWQ